MNEVAIQNINSKSQTCGATCPLSNIKYQNICIDCGSYKSTCYLWDLTNCKQCILDATDNEVCISCYSNYYLNNGICESNSNVPENNCYYGC